MPIFQFYRPKLNVQLLQDSHPLVVTPLGFQEHHQLLIQALPKPRRWKAPLNAHTRVFNFRPWGNAIYVTYLCSMFAFICLLYLYVYLLLIQAQGKNTFIYMLCLFQSLSLAKH